jgi:hypothetical protein
MTRGEVMVGSPSLRSSSSGRITVSSSLDVLRHAPTGAGADRLPGVGRVPRLGRVRARSRQRFPRRRRVPQTVPTVNDLFSDAEATRGGIIGSRPRLRDPLYPGRIVSIDPSLTQASRGVVPASGLCCAQKRRIRMRGSRRCPRSKPVGGVRSTSPRVRSVRAWAFMDKRYAHLLGGDGVPQTKPATLQADIAAAAAYLPTRRGARVPAAPHLGQHLGAALFGFSTREIRAVEAAIIDFSELGRFIDVATKNYSSGMQLHPGFSIALEVKPDVFPIDEAGGGRRLQEEVSRASRERAPSRAHLPRRHPQPAVRGGDVRPGGPPRRHARLAVLGTAKKVVRRYRGLLAGDAPRIVARGRRGRRVREA